MDTSDLDSDSEQMRPTFRKSVEKEIEERKKSAENALLLGRRSTSRGPKAETPEIEVTAPPVPENSPEKEEIKEDLKEKALVESVKKDDDLEQFEDAQEDPPKNEWKTLIVLLLKDSIIVWKDLKKARSKDWIMIKSQIRRCFLKLMVMVIFIGLGGLLFRYIEGNHESMYKCGTKRIFRNFIDHLWLSSHNLREDDWKADARNRLKKFEEELQIAFEAGVKSYSGITVWNFINSVVYCLTVVTTIGYGHIAPITVTGKTLTIIYAIFGIPLFLILLADFGKLFTRGIKFLWSYVRRLYYTGSCKKVRRQPQVQEMMRGLNVMYDMVRRPSQVVSNLGMIQTVPHTSPGISATSIPVTPVPTPIGTNPASLASTLSRPGPYCESPAAMSDMEIDDEFNLPISLAISILVIYMIVGATVYNLWEEWGFFNAFYFVFISMSTIGFGDYVPQHPIYMMCSIIYLVFGLALTSMCINVVQIKLSDTFRAASAKLGATIGLQQMAAEAGSMVSDPHSPVELAGVHVVHSKEDKTHAKRSDGFEFPKENNESDKKDKKNKKK